MRFRLPAAIAAAVLLLAAPLAAQAKPAPAEPAIQFIVVSEGEGASPTTQDVVLVAYVGRIAGGAIFDKNPQAAFPVEGVVPGFGQALQKMKPGGSYHVTIPPSLGYGPEAKGPIPANSTLVFDVMLFDFKSKAEIEAMQQQQQAPAGTPAPAPKP